MNDLDVPNTLIGKLINQKVTIQKFRYRFDSNKFKRR